MPALQLNILLLGLGVIQGCFLSFLLFKKRKTLPGYPFLAVYLIVLIVQMTMKLASKIWLMQNVGILYFSSYQLPFLYGPLIYLFAVRITGHTATNRNHLLHFLPFTLTLILVLFPRLHTLPFFFYPFVHTLPALMLQLVSLSVYHWLALIELKKYKGPVLQLSVHSMQYRLQWLHRFIITSYLVCSVVAITLFIVYTRFPLWQDIRFGFAALTIFIYWISYKAWMQPELFSVIKGGFNESTDYIAAPKLVAHLPVKKYSNSGLDEKDISEIICALAKKMATEKIYLDPDLSIDHLASAISCSRHHLSQVLNEKLNKSFYDYINQYRVEEAIHLLTDPARSTYKIASIAFDAGFNSLSTFNDVFKRITGLTPSQYRKQAGQKLLQQQRV
ncbi:MAG: helix-turn-helix domain-containing protein [Chitinophagaceae bacterium]